MVGEYGLYYDKHKMCREEGEEEEEEEHPDIRHVAPQHRQFLGAEKVKMSSQVNLVFLRQSIWLRLSFSETETGAEVPSL